MSYLMSTTDFQIGWIGWECIIQKDTVNKYSNIDECR